MQPPEKEKNGASESERQRRCRLCARRYAGELLERALEDNEYRSSTMPWRPEEHPLVMAELHKIRSSLFVVAGALP